MKKSTKNTKGTKNVKNTDSKIQKPEVHNNNRELAISTQDLNDVGINTQITSNDLVEVIATDLYNAMMNRISESKSKSEQFGKYETNYSSFKKEEEKFKQLLLSKKLIQPDDKVNFNIHSMRYDKSGTMYINEIYLNDKNHLQLRSYRINVIHDPVVKITLLASISESSHQENKIGKIISYIDFNRTKKFTIDVNVPTVNTQNLKNEIELHNKETEELYNSLPKRNLSVDSFIREARTKLNRKIISGQSPEFKQKMKDLFKISL